MEKVYLATVTDDSDFGKTVFRRLFRTAQSAHGVGQVEMTNYMATVGNEFWDSIEYAVEELELY